MTDPTDTEQEQEQEQESTESEPFYKSRRGVCWCGEKAVSGGACNAHSQFEVGDG